MRMYLLAERYAKALSECVSDDGILLSVLEALDDFSRLLIENHELRNVLLNPTVRLPLRIAVLDEILEREGPPEPTGNFIRTLLRRGRIRLLKDAVSAFSDIVDERLDRVSARITTATELTVEQEERLRQSLEKRSGKSVRLVTEVDEDIIGGVVVRLDGSVIDGSLRTRLARAKQALLAKE